MPVYIDPVANLGGFGDVRNGTLEFEGTVNGMFGGTSPLSLVPREQTGPVATLPTWVIIAAMVALVLFATSDR